MLVTYIITLLFFIFFMKIILVLFLIYNHLASDLLLTANIKYNPSGTYLINNIAGLSYDWSIKNVLNNSIFQTLVSNSNLKNQYLTVMSAYFKPSTGSGFNCKPSQFNCTNNITVEDMKYISIFGNDYTNDPYGFSLGLGFQYINYTSIQSFLTHLSQNFTYPYIYQFGQKVDTYVSRGLRPKGYDMNSYLSQINNFLLITNQSSYYLYISGPGINYTSSDWMRNMSTFFNFDMYGIFTVEMNYFQNENDCTIDNLLSQSFLSQQILNAFGGYQTYIFQQYVSISTLKIHPKNGINGITNTFATTLWALDFIATFAYMGGVGVNFYENLTQYDFQSAFTSANNFTDNNVQVNSLYYAIVTYALFMNNVYYGQYSSTSVQKNYYQYNIKIWSITDGYNTNVLLINKDTNPNLKGIVQISVPGMGTATYFYLQASSLLDTSNITISGFTYDNTTTGLPRNPKGTYGIYKTNPDSNGVYNISISYAQAVVVYIQSPTTLVSDEVWKAFSRHVLLNIIGLIGMIVLIY